ncbi:ABC transporter permease [Saccharomonospora azurea]|uniref:ABC transporter permease n=1 Tax=Saccharomonospora azurea TaxID=40988 RepID=UPI0024098430|nr:ABC transporter permease [Saccharomonospora azurea]
MKILAISRMSTIRMFRDRVNIFTVFLFPIVTVLLVGARFGGPAVGEVGIVGTGPLADSVAQRIADSGDADVRRFDDAEALRSEVAAEKLDLGVVLPPDATAQPLRVETVLGPGEKGRQLQGLLSSAVTEASFTPSVAAQLGEDGAESVRAAAERIPGIEVQTTHSEEALTPTGGAFDLAAAQQLILLIFLKPLLSASSIFQSRQYGVSRRMLSTPTSPGTIVLGEGVAQWLLAVVQGGYILLACWLLFDVSWGNLPAAVLLTLAIAAAGTGAGMLIAAVSRSENAASGMGILAGLGLGLLGGVLVPLGFFSDTMVTLAHLTPHAWAVDGFTVLHRGGDLVDILPELGVVCGFAVVLLALAGRQFHRTLTRG